VTTACLAPDCGSPAQKRGLCGSHYSLARHGAPSVEDGARARWGVDLPAASTRALAARSQRRPTPPRVDVGAQLAAWASDGTLQRLLLPWVVEGELHARRTVAGELVASVEQTERADIYVTAPAGAPGGDCQGWARDVAGARTAADAIAMGMGWRLL